MSIVCDCCGNAAVKTVTVQPAKVSLRQGGTYRLCRQCHDSLIEWQERGGTNTREKEPGTNRMLFVRRCTVHDWVAHRGDTAAMATAVGAMP